MAISEIPRSIHTERVIAKYCSQEKGAVCIFFGGIHGNEPSGVIALQEVFQELKEKKIELKGSFYALAGNIGALKEGKRFHEADLNRLWTEKRMDKVEEGHYLPENKDEVEMLSIYQEVETILQKEDGPFYFFDLHTTSAKTSPFITVNDSLLNRRFTKLYPLPLILGIEEYLDGPMLSYYNEKGFISFGFEGGEHYSLKAIENHKAFVYLSLIFTGLIHKADVNYMDHFESLAEQSRKKSHFYEIYSRFALKEGDRFKMNKGYANFQLIKKGEKIAQFNGNELKADENSMIFMPLYQAQGDDGFFLIKKTPEIFLALSKVMRWLRIDAILPLLPGVVWMSDRKVKMLVDLQIARFLTRPFLHLLGYRTKVYNEDALVIKNREADSRVYDYREESWY